MLTRNKTRIDYKVLASTGEKVCHQSANSSSQAGHHSSQAGHHSNQAGHHSSEINHSSQIEMAEEIRLKELRIQESTLRDEIEDTIEDNSPSIINQSPELMKLCVQKIETLRMQYRSKHHELKVLLSADDYELVHQKSYANTIGSISNYIRSLNHLVQQHHLVGIRSVEEINSRQAELVIQEIERSITYLETSTTCNINRITNDDLKQRVSLLGSQERELKEISSKLKELIGLHPNMETYNDLKARFENLFLIRSNYEAKIKIESTSREIEKLEAFNKSKLNIKLSKFTGFDTAIDIYTFIDEFEKLYSDNVPKSLQAELLKNNHLDKQALSLVKSIDSIDDIWDRLKSVFGDKEILLQHKLAELHRISNDSKEKDSMKVIEFLSKLTNSMRDLMQLAVNHNIENELLYSDALHKIVSMLGESRMMRWLTVSCENPKDGRYKWRQLIEFLEKEMKIHQQKAVIQISSKSTTGKFTATRSSVGIPPKTSFPSHQCSLLNIENQSSTNCVVCGAFDHVQTNGPRGIKLVQYFSCKTFVDMSAAQRFQFLKTNGLCFQCLYPGAKVDQGKHKEGKCQHDFICKHQSHDKYPTKKHVLVCDEHKNDHQNKDVLEHYKARCIMKQPLPMYSKNIQIFHSLSKVKPKAVPKADDNSHDAVFILQPITINDSNFTIFYDNGCSDFISRYGAVKRLGSRAKQVYAGTIQMNGIAGISSPTSHGIYQISLPLCNGNNAVMTGPCLDKVTNTFPEYPINGVVFDDIKHQYIEKGGDASSLPSVPEKVGGDVDLIIGIKYLRYFPKPIFQMLSGLTIYESHFWNSDGSVGLIGGPHAIFDAIHNKSTNFATNQLRLFSYGYHVNPDVRLLGYRNQFGDITQDDPTDIFNEVEHAGSEISYRCVRCRDCSTCKNTSNTSSSIKEETEQEIINNSVIVDITTQTSTATLPLISSPSRLEPNRQIALNVYNQQLRRLAKNPDDKADIIKSERKLQALGYVEYVKNLPEEDQTLLNQSNLVNFIPWRAVWKENSVSTPCRVVFDASMPTKSGFSLNDILAKGRNNMNKLVDIFLRWRGYAVSFHTDVQKMYNSIQLHKSHWGLQRYLWQDSLDPSQPPEEKIIKTLIYGVKSSGNQAERGLRETARLSKDEYPDIYKVVSEDIYVDDCLSGSETIPKILNIADRLEVVVNRGGFTLKGFTFSGQDPKESLSSDGYSVSVAGLKWYPKKDVLSIDVQDLNFAKKYRGRKPTSISSIPTNLTRRHCVSKVAELYDITGLITPIIATMKLDLHQLVKHKMDWDDILPDNLRKIWISHFEMMREIKSIHYKRAIIPEDAESLDIQTLDFGDASQALACASIYIRFKRKNGTNSCQLIFARSRIVPEGYSQPRAELFAAVLNTHTGHTVKKAFGQQHKSSMKFTDSQIALHWICNSNLTLKQWCRNRVIEVQRFTEQDQWKYVKSEDMIADLGTRRCSSLDVIKQESHWIGGYDWMKLPSSEFPAFSKDDITLSAQDRHLVSKELKEPPPSNEIKNSFFTSSSTIVPDEVSKRYKHSRYLIDPNSRSFASVIRIMVIVRKFIKKHLKIGFIKSKNVQKYITAQEDDAREAKNYFFKKATQEVKAFVPSKKYNKISQMKDGILYYTGRILSTDEATIVGNATNAMKDLSAFFFYVPIIDRHSPLAYSIVNEIHWSHPTARHSGVETTWRHVLQIVYIIEGRSLVKQIRSACTKCRYLMKQQLDVSMGPLSQDNFLIAPAFYCTQTDLAGPFLSYSNHHKRTTVKIWLIVFCCSTTTAVKIKVMEDYSTSSFLQAFTRLACEVGYPKKLLVDEGSQLIKGCESMRLNFHDLSNKINLKSSIEYKTCPVAGHNAHGRVERKIREIRESIEKSIHLERLSIIQWETLASSISNNLPLAIGNFKGNFEIKDLITPNRLPLGRNNDRCPTEPLQLSDDADKIIRSNTKIFNAWFECWLASHVPLLIYQPKWFKSDRDLKPGDVVLFTKNESTLSSTYQYGMVKSVSRGRDEKIRSVVVEYRNANENVKRQTNRSVRSLVLILGVDGVDMSKELFKSR